MTSNIILIFIDGIGLGEESDLNPFYTTNMTYLNSILGEKLGSNINISKENVLVKGVDACLGITNSPPQSATGQASLLTGINAAQLLGYHLTAYPNEELIQMIHQHNILKKVQTMGLSGTFSNAYDIERYNRNIQSGKIRHSVTTHCVLSTGLPFRTIEQLKQNQAIYWDITGDYLSDYHPDLGSIDPYVAGQNLSNLSKENNFVLFECFLPDLIGHKKKWKEAELFLKTFDRFIEGCHRHLDQNTSIVISSDHGNMEDLSKGSHTYNEVPLIVLGPACTYFIDNKSITDVSKSIILSLTNN